MREGADKAPPAAIDPPVADGALPSRGVLDRVPGESGQNEGCGMAAKAGEDAVLSGVSEKSEQNEGCGGAAKANEEAILAQVQRNIDRLARAGVSWSQPASDEAICRAREGAWELSISGGRPLPREWFPADLGGFRVLCLAGAGGLQGPLLAAAGAEVTVLDLSCEMLGRDRDKAKRHGLPMRLMQGNMGDLSAFSDGAFDMVLNPPSLFYVPDVRPVFRECFRVLRPGGTLVLCAPNPTNYLCDWVEDGGYFRACNRLPYSASARPDMGDWVEYGHTLQSLLGGQTDCGFAIVGFFEDGYEKYPPEIPFCDDVCFVTRAVKPQC